MVCDSCVQISPNLEVTQNPFKPLKNTRHLGRVRTIFNMEETAVNPTPNNIKAQVFQAKLKSSKSGPQIRTLYQKAIAQLIAQSFLPPAKPIDI